jgi:N-acetylneuraminate synthase
MEGRRVEIVAEIGTGHRGDPGRLADLIISAAEAGADTLKCQIVIAREILHPATGSVPLPGGDTPLYEVFQSLEQPPEFYADMKSLAAKAGLRFLATPFGPESARLLRGLKTGRCKIASPEVNHIPLLEEVSRWKEPVILSTGVTKLGDIETALQTLRGTAAMILHCVTAYPAPETDYNLRLLPLYHRLFGLDTGVSDHSLDQVLVPVLSVAMGGMMIEKHLTLSRGDSGLDDPVALEPADFKKMVTAIREAETQMADEIIDDLGRRYGQDRVEAVLGTGRKTLAPSEEANYGRTNRSLHALTALKAGDVLTEANLGVLRTEKILRPGLSPAFYKQVLGRRVTRDVADGEGVCWEDLLV